MDLLDVTQSVVERCERSAPASELGRAFQCAVERLAFRHLPQLMSTYLHVPVGYQRDMLVSHGTTDLEISQLLGVGVHTVHKHAEAAKRRLDVSARISPDRMSLAASRDLSRRCRASAADAEASDDREVRKGFDDTRRKVIPAYTILHLSAGEEREGRRIMWTRTLRESLSTGT